MKFVNPKSKFVLMVGSILWLGCTACNPLISIGNKSLLSYPSADYTSACQLSEGTYSAPPALTLPKNEMEVTVNGSLCGPPGEQYANEPCVSVTICQPGTTNCQTINNILLDTGSYGLRVFSSLVTIPLNPITQGSSQVAECMTFGDGSSEWGPLVFADVRLGGEVASRVPIELINQSFASPPSLCTSAQSTPDVSPTSSYYNGVLGVGVFVQDCGDYCANTAQNQQYYACSGDTCGSNGGGTCTQVAVSDSDQVSNPIAFFAGDNNGLVLQLPSISGAGAPSTTGTVIFGIGTESNNVPGSVTTYTTDQYGEFTTVFSAYSSTPMSSFLDTGSNFLYFPAIASLPDCGITYGSVWNGLFCPTNAQNLTAVNTDATGTNQGTVSFTLENAYNLLNSGNASFSDVGDNVLESGGTASFDFGLPFFYGRTVYVGFGSSSLGTGSYWAY
jgi:hypothetical protein